MSPTDILLYKTCKKEVKLVHSCKVAHGIEDNDHFIITDIIGNFDQLIVTNQYDQKVVINPNQIIK